VNWEALDAAILGPALLAGLLVAATHVPLGRRVLERGIIFLDLAVAQVAGLGLVAAHSLHFEPDGWQVQAVALGAAALAALALNLSEQRWPQLQEALIGSLFVIASSASILLLATNPHGGEQLKELLVGQILWAGYGQLTPVALLYGAILAVWFAAARHGTSLLFYLLFALAITASVQLVGVYLVFATLILPALAVRSCRRHALLWGYLIAAAGYTAGLLLSALLDLPAGAMIVLTLAVAATLGAALLQHRENTPIEQTRM
jgi:zinc/manganese transport system permease protein